MAAKITNLKTADDGLTVYDLDPLAADLWAVAGPPGYDPTKIDPDVLPEGFRWIEPDEWSEMVANESEREPAPVDRREG